MQSSINILILFYSLSALVLVVLKPHRYRHLLAAPNKTLALLEADVTNH